MNGHIETLVPQSVYPPPGAYLYKPEGDKIASGKGKHIQRHIFKGQTLTELEAKKLARLEEEVKKLKIQIPENWDKNELLRFCFGTGWKTRKALKEFQNHLKWKRNTFPRGYLSVYPEVAELLALGAFYVHGRDHFYRPILIMNCTKFQFKKIPDETYIRFLCFFFEYVTQNILLPGHVETWVNIADMGHWGMTQLPISSLRKLSKIIQANFKCRLGINYVINPPSTAVIMWNFVKPFLDEVTLHKMNVLKESIPKPLFNHCNLNQIEVKYGGTAPNVTTFWPPTFPSGPISPFDETAREDTYGEPDINIKKKRKSKQRAHTEIIDVEEVIVDMGEISENNNIKLESLIETAREEEQFIAEEEAIVINEDQATKNEKETKNDKETKNETEIKRRRRISKTYKVINNDIDIDEETGHEEKIRNKKDNLKKLVFEDYHDNHDTHSIEPFVIIETRAADTNCGFLSVPNCTYNLSVDKCSIL